MIPFVIVSCQVSVKKENSSSDIEEARKYSMSFYHLIKEREFESAARYFGPTIGYEDGLGILKNVNEHIGSLDTIIYLTGNSNKTVSANKKQEEYVLNFKAVYNKMEANEEMVIELINDSLKITGYHPRVTVPPN